MSVKRGNPKELFNSTQYGFSQAVSAIGTRVVCISGQVAWDAEQTLTGAGDLFVETSDLYQIVRADSPERQIAVGDSV